MSDTRSLITPCWALCVAFALLLPASLIADDLDDPMRPTPRQAEPETDTEEPAEDAQPAAPTRFNPDHYRVTEIYMVGNIKRARINGTWYHPGDTLLNAEVLDIMPQAAVIEADDRYHMLYLDRPRATFNLFEESQ